MIWLMTSKILAAISTPMVMTAVAVASAVLPERRARRFGFWFAAFAIGQVWAFSTPVVAKWLTRALEQQFPAQPIAQFAHADVAVVLGGATRGAKAARPEVELGSAGNRVLYAARLYKAGKVDRIIISAGNLTPHPTDPREADDIAKLLTEFGVPRSAILLESESRTTRENAEQTRDIWLKHGIQSGLLVTSALHMARAMVEFRRHGLPVIAATTDVLESGALYETPLDIIPSAAALARSTEILREMLGWAVATLRPHP